MSRRPRLASALLAAFVVAIAASGGAAPRAAAADLTVDQAELEMVRLLNAERAKAGLVAVRVDSRLMSIAGQRSADMAARQYFSHTQPDGRDVFDIIAASGITWYGAGEIIAWNSGWPTLAESAAAARNGWMASSGHRSIVMSGSYNYVGIGLAEGAGGRMVWTGVFMKGPDRTGGWVTFKPLPDINVKRGTYRTVTVYWSGGDTRLVVLTAGHRKYQIQVRTDGGSWRWWSYGTTATSKAIRVWGGRNYDMRVRECDRAGNCGTWRVQHIDS